MKGGHRMTIKSKIAAITAAATIMLTCGTYFKRNIITAEYYSAENSTESKVEDIISDMTTKIILTEVTLSKTTETQITQTTYATTKSTTETITTQSTFEATVEAETNASTTTLNVETDINQEKEEKDNSEWISTDDVTISYDMDIAKPTGLSKDDFVNLIANLPYDYYGYFERNAGLIWELCQQKSVNEIAACGIIAHESGWAKVSGFGQNNYFGIRGGNYSSEEEGLRAFINMLSDKYLSESGPYYKGKTLYAVGLTYCDGDVWPGKVYGCMKLILWY